jgi:hypothetical protein
MKQLVLSIICLAALSFANAQCEFGEHSINWEDAWMSCEVANNPNSVYENGHWIMYDLGSPHEFFASHIWNYNVTGQTGIGIRNCNVDFSLDGVTWVNYGNIEIPQANGANTYTGVDGPDFNGMVGRYMLVSVIDNWNGDACSGLAEIRVNVEQTTVNIAENKGFDVVVYPNPVSDQLVVRHYQQDKMQLTVFDISGNLVVNQPMNGSTVYINVSNLSNGLYIVKLSTNQGVSSTQRFVISH